MNSKEKAQINKVVTELELILTNDFTQNKPNTSLQWENIFNAIPMPVFIKDRAHNWIIFNDALCTLQGKTKLELQNKNDYDFFDKPQADEFWAQEEEIFKTKKETFVEETAIRNGIQSYVLIKKTIVTTPNGDDYLIGCCIDITERKKAELALIASEKRFKALVQYSPDIIIILEKDHNIRYITPSFYRVFGYAPAEVIGQSVFNFIANDDVFNVKKKLAALLNQTEKISPIAFKAHKKDGEIVILESFFNNLLNDPALNGIVINCSDITQLLKQANEIRRINNLLKKDNQKLTIDLKNEVKARVNLKAVNLNDFKNIYPDNEACYSYLAELKWKDGYTCKKCKHTKAGKGKAPFAKRCTVCGYDESATAHTIFYRIKFPIVKAFCLVFLITSQKKITAKNLATLVVLRVDTCSVFKRKLLAQLKNDGKLSPGWENLILVENKKKTKVKA